MAKRSDRGEDGQPDDDPEGAGAFAAPIRPASAGCRRAASAPAARRLAASISGVLPAGHRGGPQESATSSAFETSSTKTNSRPPSSLRRDLGRVALVARGNQHPFDPRPLRRQRLLPHAADRQHLAGERDLACHRRRRRRPARRVQSDASAVAIVTPADGPSFGHRPGRDVDVHVVVGEPVALGAPSDPACAAHAGERRLRRLLHHFAELAGDRQLALAGIGGRLDEEHVAAGRRLGEARWRRRGRVVRLRDLARRSAAARAISRSRLLVDARLCLRFAFGDLARRLCGRSSPIRRSRFRTPASRVYSRDDRAQRRVGEARAGSASARVPRAACGSR